ncbi:MAG: bifunctional folylpolyglutamate synthase/dihydrofolate synthase [Zetaproteobacteria bacterium]|nr:MAG: bifunctional folylpolyglutamate synthase/dihydrofolate synthase [Zetaproteobacteria bacterium]
MAQLGNPAADRDYQPGHARIHALLAHIHRHRPRLRIRIAGTNGKGSTGFMLSEALKAAGLTVGLYTSPHLRRFNERIRLQGVPVADEHLRRALERIMPHALRIGASYFEVATALALDIFADADVDAEILEAGVGARLDATTAVPADMALLTPIGLDHQAWLGDSLSAIAQEKAHIMDGCRRVLSAPQPACVMRVLRAHRSDLIIAQSAWSGTLATPGQHQRINAGLAWLATQTLQRAGLIVADTTRLRAAIADTRVPGRLQYVRWGERHIWLDAAHNEHAIEALLPTLPELAQPLDAILLFTRPDRDLSHVLPRLRPYTRRLIAGQNAAGSFDRLRASLETELTSRAKGAFLVLGSFTTVAAALDWLETNIASNRAFNTPVDTG